MFEEELKSIEKKGLLREVSDRRSPQGARITINNAVKVNFASNDYLGLAGHEALREAAMRALEDYGAGAGAARLLAGGTAIHKELEDKVALFMGSARAIIFNSGYHANLGAIPALAGPEDAIFSDELNHASIIDGCRLSRAKTSVYRHRDTGQLENMLREAKKTKRRLIVTESVFSMDGDIAPLGELYGLARSHDAILYIDEAHAIGVLGGCRGGLAHFGLRAGEPGVVRMGTFSKALGSYGAFVAADAETITWLTNTARTFMFSTALPPGVIGASLAALGLVESGQAPIERLWANRAALLEALQRFGFDTGESETPIMPVFFDSVEDALRVSGRLGEMGIYAPAIRPPTVKRPRLRVSVTASHSPGDIESLVNALNGAKIL